MIKYTMDDLLPEVKEKILDELHRSVEWVALQKKLVDATNKRNYIKMQQITQLMHQKEVDVVYEYLQLLDDEKVRVADLIDGMSKRDANKLLTKLNGIGFLCDILYGYVIDSTDIIQKYFPDSNLIFYNKLVELQKEVKMHIKHVIDGTTLENETYFCTQSDRAANYIDKIVKEFMKEQQRLKDMAEH